MLHGVFSEELAAAGQAPMFMKMYKSAFLPFITESVPRSTHQAGGWQPHSSKVQSHSVLAKWRTHSMKNRVEESSTNNDTRL